MLILTYDIETLLEYYLIKIYNPETKKWHKFGVNRWENSLDALLKFIDQHKDYYFVGFNCLRFDSQVCEWIFRNNEKWIDLSNLEICQRIHQKAQDVIDDANYELYPEYREEWLSFKQIDLFTIWHFNNENRRTSLKALEFAMDMENIEEMPISHDAIDLSIDDIKTIDDYCDNDVLATYQFYLITIGQTDMKLYKGENKITDRIAMKEEFGLSCMNWDDVKIGAEWNKLDYVALSGRNERDLKPKQIKHYFGKKFKQFFPKTVRFQTEGVKKFVKEFGDTFAKNEKQEFKYKLNDELTAVIAKGGIHSNEKGRFIKPEEDEIYYQIDIGSQYPNGIRKYKVEPDHLPGWNGLIVSKIDRRLKHKKLGQETKDPKYNSLQKMGKLALNGGSYGRLNTKGDWQEYPIGMLQVTIGGQLEILMVVEDLLMKGFRVISLNTDGFDVVFKRDREAEFRAILTEYEKIIGNDVLGNFEYTEFKWIAQTSVNDYIALKTDGGTKLKGDFEIDKELNKNKSNRIVPIALKAYFVEGTPIETTIKNHKNIYDFCARAKSSKDFHYEGVTPTSKRVYNKLIRYYISNKGEKLLKIKNPSCMTNAAEVSQVNAGEWLSTVCNKLPKATRVEDCNIDYSFYILKAQEIIDKIKLEGRKPAKKQPVNQLNMFS